MHRIVTPGFVDRPRRGDCTAGQMNGEADWWITSGNIRLSPLARVMGVGRQQQGGGEKERRFSVNICTQPSHVHDSNHVNNFNETLYIVNGFDEPLHNINSLNETLLNESKLQHGLKCIHQCKKHNEEVNLI